MSFEMRIRPYRTVDNVITGVVCTFVDVTLRDKIEAEILESEKQFHALAESIPLLAWIMDAKGYIFWFNQRWFDYTNTTLDEMKGQGWRSVHDPAEVDRVVKHLNHCVKTGEVWEDTFPLRGADSLSLVLVACPAHSRRERQDRPLVRNEYRRGGSKT